MIEGQLEVTIGGKTQVAGAGFVAIVPPDTKHFVKAITDGRAIVVDYPLRREISEATSSNRNDVRSILSVLISNMPKKAL